jgi:hypothetical protein
VTTVSASTAVQWRLRVDFRIADSYITPRLSVFEALFRQQLDLLTVGAVLEGNVYSTIDGAIGARRQRVREAVRVEKINYGSPLDLLLSFPGQPFTSVAVGGLGLYTVIDLYNRYQTLRLTKAKRDVQVAILKQVLEEVQRKSPKEPQHKGVNRSITNGIKLLANIESISIEDPELNQDTN